MRYESGPAQGKLRLFLVVGEHSGDQLGFKLMRALREATDGPIAFSGVGGEAMAAEGLQSLFPLADIAVMGILPVIAKLPTLLARIKQTAQAVVAARPDALVIIDSPDFTHRVARRVRKALPRLPIIDYVSPSVLGVQAARPRQGRCAPMSIACLPCCPSNPPRTKGSPVRHVSTSAIRSSNAWPNCAPMQ